MESLQLKEVFSGKEIYDGFEWISKIIDIIVRHN